jgi:hypothetical protein
VPDIDHSSLKPTRHSGACDNQEYWTNRGREKEQRSIVEQTANPTRKFL